MISFTIFQAAFDRIRSYVRETPVTYHESSQLSFKWESHQPTHSFKVRGAFNKILSLDPLPPLLITGSAGNHGQAVALAAQLTGTQAWVFVPENTPHVKVNKMLELGAKVERVAGLYGDAEARAIQMAKEMEMPFISPYNDLEVISGAGTIALEWLAQTPVGRILVPAGGGGLLTGVGLAAKAIHPEIEVIGVLSEASPYLYHHFYDGHTREVVERPTLTDGLAGAVEAGSITLDLLHQACDAVVQVTEAEVGAAIAMLYRQLGEVVEGSGAVGLAAVLAGKVPVGDRQTGTIISGGNIDRERLAQVLGEHL